jgi:hypothetical protein
VKVGAQLDVPAAFTQGKSPQVPWGRRLYRLHSRYKHHGLEQFITAVAALQLLTRRYIGLADVGPPSSNAKVI